MKMKYQVPAYFFLLIVIRGVPLHLWEDSNLLSSRLNVTVKRADKRQNLHEIQDQIGVHPSSSISQSEFSICRAGTGGCTIFESPNIAGVTDDTFG